MVARAREEPTLTPSEPTPVPARSSVETGRAVALDEAVVALVADALSEATPRSATLALLHFNEYLALLRRVGLDVCPSGPLASALRTGLSRVCLADGLRLRAHG
jgi:hypothetical protein